MTRAVVTGGAGFLGSHLCRRLMDAGWEVVCLDNLLTGNADNIADLIGRDGFRFIHHNVTEFIHVAGPVDRVLHFASPGISPRLPGDADSNTEGRLAGNSQGAGPWPGEKGARILLASTSEVYGDPLINPQTEDYWGNVNPIGPRGVYDEAKRFAEAMTVAYGRYHGMDTRVVRIFNTYGPQMRPDDGRVVSNFIVQALKGEPLTIYGKGEQTRSFCYVADLVEGILKLLEADRSEDTALPFNIGNPEERTVGELAQRILRLTDSRSEVETRPLPEDDPQVRCPDIGRARRHLGWEPQVEIDEGLRQTIDYFRKILIG